jgi:DNA-binding transcriptional LysR family regulator
MHRDLQISLLRTLVAVVDEGGFRKAAEALHLSQPAVSQQMRRLSAIVRQPVFESGGRTLRLSPAGEKLLEYARRIVSMNDEAVSHFVAPCVPRQVLVGVSEPLAGLLSPFMKQLVRRMPGIQVSVVSGATRHLADQLAAGRLDLALLLGDVTPPGRGALMVRELGTVELAWFGRPAEGPGGTMPLAVFSEPCRLRASVIDTLERAALRWHIGYEGADLAGVRAAVDVGLGISCLVADAGRLWGLPVARHPDLPEPPAPMGVAMALAPGLPPDMGVVALESAAEALRHLPFHAEVTGPREVAGR